MHISYESFLHLLRQQGLYHSYPVKGAYFLDPFSTLMLKKIDDEFCKLSKINRSLISTLVPAKSIQKELTKFNMSDDHLYKVDDYYLKPTSESLLYDSMYFKKHCKMAKDLPAYFSYVNRVYRHEDRSQPLVRHSEILWFTEVHEVHKKDAHSKPIMDAIVQIYTCLFNKLRIRHLVLERPDYDRFAGALTTIAFDTVIDGKRLQIATLHHLGTQWADIYELSYKEGIHSYRPQQYCYGHSERVYLALLYFNYNGSQLCLPSFMRGVQMIFVDRPSYHISYVDLTHCINHKQLSNIIQKCIWRDSIILIHDARHEKIKVIDRDQVYFVDVQYIDGLYVRTNNVETFINDSSYFDAYITYKNERCWGTNLSKTYMYSGASF